MDEQAGENQAKVGEEFRSGGMKTEPLDGTDQDKECDGAVRRRSDLEIGGADQKGGRSRFEQNEIQFSGADELGEFGKSGHQKGGEDLDHQLVGGDEDDHLVPVPAGHLVHVVVDDADEGELDNKPSQLDTNPDEEAGPKHQLAGGRVPDLEKPEAKEFHSASGGSVAPQTGLPDEMGQDHEEKRPAVLETKAGLPGLVGEMAAEGGGREPVLVGEGQKPDDGENRCRKKIEGKAMGNRLVSDSPAAIRLLSAADHAPQAVEGMGEQGVLNEIMAVADGGRLSEPTGPS